ncbi:unnamed protein product [Brassica rapa]|uniref:DNA2/NAM7 helicase-like C-terminal domain-containing protein n=2 Tax=Brassica TaxID=3705 RepID=A0A3P5Y271_BRACM|nr:unnamed protein product [Brassica napus]CAG7864068.1 unnamed protein product [Brassica rapa]VDC61349.1 unnamed protein product [Brassica rapa]
MLSSTTSIHKLMTPSRVKTYPHSSFWFKPAQMVFMDRDYTKKKVRSLVAESWEFLYAIPVTKTRAFYESSDSSKPIEFLVRHGEAPQELCDTVCNLYAVSTSTGLGGMHLVLFKVGGNHRLPPTTLSPGDMVCIRICDSKGAGATSCTQGFVHSLGDDGCSIGVALESRHGDPTFSKLFGKSVRIDRIHGLADALTYEPTWITQCPLLLLDTRMSYGSLSMACEERLDPAGTGSLYNEGEADIVVNHVIALIYAGVSTMAIAVQSPYVAQVQLLRERLDDFPVADGVEVATIDSFQGREADAVIISMVRSNNLSGIPRG